jgi:hypothetical protein
MAQYARTISVEFDGSDVGDALRRAGVKIEVGLGTIARRATSQAVAGAKQRGGQLGGVHRHVLPGLYILAAGNVVKLDVRRSPAILGAEFGGRRSRRTQQFPPWRGNSINAGYFFYPALRAEERNIQALIAGLISEAL